MRRSQQPVIVINGVTYGSPDEIPQHLRALWDENIRTLEQHGVDWRAQQRIDLTWSHERDFVSQRFRIEGAHHHGSSQPQTLLSALFGVYLVFWMALTFYGLMWHDPPLIFDFSSGLLYVLVVLFYVPWVLIFVSAFRRRERLARQRFSGQEELFAAVESRHNLFLNPETPAWKLAGAALVGMAATAMMTYFAVFGGAPKLLHYAERKPGEMTAVVTATRAYASKQCYPWIALDGFRYTGDRLCVNPDFFRRVNAGDRVRLTGMMSRYAMDPEGLEVVVDD
jgi:4-amino-4-deoxy-L-arabinose transferase-like glycosyltransferase